MPQVYSIQISVTNLDQAIAWYCEVLGFEVSRQYHNPPFSVDLVHEHCRLVLHKVLHDTVIDYPRVSQTLIALETKNIIDAMERFKEKGVEFIYPKPRQTPTGLFTAFKDPFGNILELVEITA